MTLDAVHDPDLFNRLKTFIDQTEDNWNYIFPEELNRALKRGEPLFLLDVRRAEDHAQMHIPGTVNIFWLDLLKDDNLSKLPRDQEIVIICYVGHTASQVLVLLRLLGFKASILKFGMGIPPDPLHPVRGWVQLRYEVETE